LGYAVHILTDILWKETVFSSFLSECATDKTPYEKTRLIYYSDAEETDTGFYERFELESDVRGYLSGCRGIGIADLVTVQEVISWKENTLRLFDDLGDLRSRPLKYFTYEIISDFIENATSKISNLLPAN
jgi:hypothetical protein